MTADALPGHGGRSRHRRTAPARRGAGHAAPRGRQLARPGTARLSACLSCVAMAVAAVAEDGPIRGLEAWLAGHVIGLLALTTAGSAPRAAVFWFTARQHVQVGMEITPECTVAFLFIPFLLATAWLVWLRPSARAPLTALGTATALLVLLNQMRFLTIAWLVRSMGFSSGFYWGHTWLGSLITVLGLALILGIYSVIAIGRARPRRRAVRPREARGC